MQICCEFLSIMFPLQILHCISRLMNKLRKVEKLSNIVFVEEGQPADWFKEMIQFSLKPTPLAFFDVLGQQSNLCKQINPR